MRSTLVGWGVGIAAYGLILGLVARSGGSALSSSASMTRALSRLGAIGAYAYLGVAFLMMAVILALVAAGQISAARSEEAGGRLDHFLVRPVSRSSWLAGRLLIATIVLVVGGLLAGVFTWLGAASQHTGVSFASVLDAGLNVVPPAVCILGIGTFVLGVWPRASTVATYCVVVWSFLVELMGGVVGLNHWVLDASLFHQMAAAPAVSPDWTTGGVLVAIGAVAAVLGGTAFAHRDLKGE
jgi:ABC-2 type transport system permease protein